MSRKTIGFKGTLICRFGNLPIRLHIKKKYVEGITLKQVLLFEICAREVCEKFAYKHSETIEC